MGDKRKDVRLHILVDEAFKKMVDHAAHDSWMSVGHYIRDIVALLEGASYDQAVDVVMVGREIGIEAFNDLREAAERKGISVREFCQRAVGQKASSSTPPSAPAPAQEKEKADPHVQINLFEV